MLASILSLSISRAMVISRVAQVQGTGIPGGKEEHLPKSKANQPVQCKEADKSRMLESRGEEKKKDEEE